MSQALAVREPNEVLAPRTISDLQILGKALAQSGFFQDAREAAQAMTKIMAGAELGFPPVASMTGIYVVKGRISLSANLMAAAIKRSGRYDYRVITMTNEACEIHFFEIGLKGGEKVKEKIGESTFTKAEAAKAGTQNMDKFPRNMLFARAMSNGAKWFCADIFAGPVYTPEEMGAQVTEDGEIANPAALAAMPRPQAVPSNVQSINQEPVGAADQDRDVTEAEAELDVMLLDHCVREKKNEKAGKAYFNHLFGKKSFEEKQAAALNLGLINPADAGLLEELDSAEQNAQTETAVI